MRCEPSIAEILTPKRNTGRCSYQNKNVNRPSQENLSPKKENKPRNSAIALTPSIKKPRGPVSNAAWGDLFWRIRSGPIFCSSWICKHVVWYSNALFYAAAFHELFCKRGDTRRCHTWVDQNWNNRLLLFYFFRTWSSESSNLRRYGRGSSHATFRVALLGGAASLRSEIYNWVWRQESTCFTQLSDWDPNSCR